MSSWYLQNVSMQIRVTKLRRDSGRLQSSALAWARVSPGRCSCLVASKVTTPCPGKVLEAARIWLGDPFFSCPVVRSMACSLQVATGNY